VLTFKVLDAVDNYELFVSHQMHVSHIFLLAGVNSAEQKTEELNGDKAL